MGKILLFDAKVHDRQSFQNREESITRYLQKHATQDIKRGYAQVYIVPEDDERASIAGYMALNARALDTRDFPAEIAEHFGSRRVIPMVELGRLGVDIRCEGQGIAKALVYHAIQLTVTSPFGVSGLLVKALTPAIMSFYTRLGFVLLPGDQDFLFLDRRAMPTVN